MDNIISKINKLLELARRGGTVDESKTARKMADLLLKKYNLLLADVQNGVDEDDYMFDGAMTNTLRATWQDSIYVSISKLYFCTFHKTYSEGGRAVRTILGDLENVAKAKKIAAHIVLIAITLSKESYQDAKSIRAFKRGFATRIWTRVDEQMIKTERGALIDAIPEMKAAEEKAAQEAAQQASAANAAARGPKELDAKEKSAFEKGASIASFVSLELHEFLKT